MDIRTKEQLVEELRTIRSRGWIPNARPGNVGGVGNTLEDLLGIQENNLPIPNAAEWELKCRREDTSSLGTLFHMEPSPRALKFVPKIFLLKYGWRHEEAGKKHPQNEISFRQTINALSRTDRGFGVVVNRHERKIKISFDSQAVDERHSTWLESVREEVGLGELNPQPYWGFDDLIHKAGTKLKNCFFVVAKRKIENGVEHFLYDKIFMFQGFSGERFISAIEHGNILIDFDSRTHHNHGTKFRVRRVENLCDIYEVARVIE
jgi:hypothetical protein